MADPRLGRLFEQLRASRLAPLAGARVSASLPLPDYLLNDLIAAALPATAPVREVAVRPLADNRVSVRTKLARPAFLPAITVTLQIEAQPEFPDSPLVLRLTSMPGLLSVAGNVLPVASMLPPGIRLEEDRVLVDIRTVLERHGYGEIVPYLEKVRVTCEDGRLIVDVNLRVQAYQ